MNKHEDLVHPSFPSESKNATRLSGDVIDMSKQFDFLQRHYETMRDQYGSYSSSLTGDPKNSAKILSFPEGKEKKIDK